MRRAGEARDRQLGALLCPRQSLPCRAAGPGAGAASSAMVFHSPHDSQRPLHLVVTAPHDWQTKRASGRAMSVKVVLRQAPAVAVQPAGLVLVVRVAAQAAHRRLALGIAERFAERCLVVGLAGTQARIEGHPAA